MVSRGVGSGLAGRWGSGPLQQASPGLLTWRQQGPTEKAETPWRGEPGTGAMLLPFHASGQHESTQRGQEMDSSFRWEELQQLPREQRDSGGQNWGIGALFAITSNHSESKTACMPTTHF